jgi:glyoxalase family protein
MSNRATLTGLHHIAVVSRQIDQTADFYGRVLGLGPLGQGPAPFTARDARGELSSAPALYFGDGQGGSGIILSVLDRPGASQGAPGIGGTHHFALAVSDREILLRWKRRLLDAGYPVNGILDRHYFQSIYTRDPDGTIVELATMGPGWTIDEPPDCLGESHIPPPTEMLNTNRDRARVAAENWPEPVPDIIPGMRVRGLHHVTAIGANIEQIHTFVSDHLGMRRVKRTNNFDDAASFHWYWGVGAGAPGTLVTYFERRPEREQPVRLGSGQVAHYGMEAVKGSLESLASSLGAWRQVVSDIGRFGPEGLRFDALATEDPDGQTVVIAAKVSA